MQGLVSCWCFLEGNSHRPRSPHKPFTQSVPPVAAATTEVTDEASQATQKLGNLSEILILSCFTRLVWLTTPNTTFGLFSLWPLRVCGSHLPQGIWPSSSFSTLASMPPPQEWESSHHHPDTHSVPKPGRKLAFSPPGRFPTDWLWLIS